jgi:hypothetical protein
LLTGAMDENLELRISDILSIDGKKV